MKNREKFAKEILDIVCNGGSIGIDKSTNKPIDCKDLECINCSLGGNCITGISKWSESEYVEKSTITLKEKAFLNAITFRCKYIARDSDNALYVYCNKPRRDSMSESWITEDNCYYVSKDMYDNMFDFIKWEDEKPWNIEDLKKLEVKDE